MGTESFLGVKRSGHVVDHSPSSSTDVKKESSYTSTLLLSLRGLFQVEIYLNLHIF